MELGGLEKFIKRFCVHSGDALRFFKVFIIRKILRNDTKEYSNNKNS